MATVDLQKRKKIGNGTTACASLVTLSGAFAALKEKHSRIDARIFPNPNVGFIVFPDKVTKKKATLKGGIVVTLSGLEPEFAP